MSAFHDLIVVVMHAYCVWVCVRAKQNRVSKCMPMKGTPWLPVLILSSQLNKLRQSHAMRNTTQNIECEFTDDQKLLFIYFIQENNDTYTNSTGECWRVSMVHGVRLSLVIALYSFRFGKGEAEVKIQWIRGIPIYAYSYETSKLSEEAFVLFCCPLSGESALCTLPIAARH